MFENKLKLNPEKTEFIVVSSMDKHKWLKDSFPVNILGNFFSPTDVVHNLGVLFNSKFSFRIRCFLSYDVSVMVTNALVSSRLDYCNSLFCSVSCKNIARLWNIENCLARFVSDASKFFHVTLTLKSLHWLSVKQQTIFKTLVLIH